MRVFFPFIIVIAVYTALFFWTKDAHLISDEYFHFDQIVKFYYHDWRLNPDLTTIPTYHLLISLVTQVFNQFSVPFVREVSLLFGSWSLIIFYLIAKKLDSESAKVRLLQFSFFPIIAPFFFLIYTDIFALAFVLLSLYLILIKRYLWSGIAAIMAVLVRQNNIIWLVFLYLLIYLRENEIFIDLSRILNHLKKNWTYLLGIGLYILFIFINKGVSLGQKAEHPLTFSNPGNIYFFLFLYFFLYLPENLTYLGKIIRLVDKNKWMILLWIVGLGLFLVTFHPNHPYNLKPFYLRNQILMFFSSDYISKIIFYIFMVFGLLSIAVTKSANKYLYLLYPFIILSLMPSWLIEQRYYIIPMALLMLFKKRKTDWADYLSIILYLTLTIVLLSGIRVDRFFP